MGIRHRWLTANSSDQDQVKNRTSLSCFPVVWSGSWQSPRGSWDVSHGYSSALQQVIFRKPSSKSPVLHPTQVSYRKGIQIKWRWPGQKHSGRLLFTSLLPRFVQKCHRMNSGAISPFPLTGKSRNSAHFIKRHTIELMTVKGRFW